MPHTAGVSMAGFRGLIPVIALMLALGAPGPFAIAGAEARAGVSTPAPDAASALRARIADRVNGDLRPFYATRAYRPLWLNADGRLSPAATALAHQVETAALDGIRPGKVKASQLAKALDRAASGDPDDLARAELALSQSYVAWVKALRGAKREAMLYETAALAPVVPTTTAALQNAAAARTLDRHIATMAWMHPLYAPMRAALADATLDDAARKRLQINLRRVRALPAAGGRHVLVDAAGARLWLYENGRPVDTMRVVVGRTDQQTPMMAGFLRHAIINPYWNVPDDLVRDRIAANVVAKGPGYLRTSGYEVLADWGASPAPLDPATVDWRAVAAGQIAPPRVRQKPGADNFMGGVKFMFPNEQGIYLHDTPDKGLLLDDARQYSSGCVRLQDARRLGRWLLGRPLPRETRAPERTVPLPEPVPLYITYLTAMPENGKIAWRDDVYGRDGKTGRKPRADSPAVARSR